MKRRLWFTLTLTLALWGILLIAGIGAGRLASAAEVELPARSLAAAGATGGGPLGSDFNISQKTDTNIEPGESAVAYNSEREEYLVVWCNVRQSNDDIEAQRLSKDGVLLSSFFISGGSGAERSHPDVAYNSKHDEYVVVWEHDAGSGPEIHAIPVAATGGVDPADEVTIASTSVAVPSYPAVDYAYTSDKYLVVWFEERTGFSSIWGQVLTGAGVLSGSNFYISQDTGNNERYNPDVAYNRSSNEYLVVWQQKDPSTSDYHIYARKVRGDGTPMNVPSDSITIEYASQDQKLPAVAAVPNQATGGQYLVVWEDHRSCGTVACVEAQRVKASGVLTGSNFSIAWNVNAGDYTDPDVAGSESRQQYLVGWTEPQQGFANTMIGGRAISTGGDAVGEQANFGTFAGEAAVASGDVGDFLVTFTDSDLLQINIYGHLWGNRVYLPLVLRNYQ